MIEIKPQKKEKIDFQLENSHYRKLNLYLYFLSITVSVLFYFLIVNIFSSYYKMLITAIASLLVGLFLLFNRSKIIKYLSQKIHEKNIKKRKEENKKGLESTIKRIKPSHKNTRNLKLNIGGKKNYIKDKITNLREKLTRNKNEKSEYIEIK